MQLTYTQWTNLSNRWRKYSKASARSVNISSHYSTCFTDRYNVRYFVLQSPLVCLNSSLTALIVLFSIASLRNVTCFLSVCLLQLCPSLLLTSRVIVHSLSSHLLLWNMQVLRGYGMKGSNAVRQTLISLCHIYCYRRVKTVFIWCLSSGGAKKGVF